MIPLFGAAPLLLAGAADVARDVIGFADNVILVYFLALNSFYALLLILSIPELWGHWHLAEDEQLKAVLGSEALPPLTILVPAYNEQVTIAESVLSFLTLQYPRHEVVLVNDGSPDRTMDVLIAEYDLYEVPPAFPVAVITKPVRAYYRSRRFSKLLVIDKENGGKADALNAATNAARYPYVLAVDADTLIEPDALLRLARPFLLGKNVAAVGGTIRVANACRIEYGRVVEAAVDRRWLPGIQTVEYLRAFLFGRLGWNRIGGNMIISGAFGLFRRDHIVAIGGYRTSTVGEDMDLVVRLRRYLRQRKLADEIPFIPDPVAWTEVPTSARVLGRQRERWHRGLIEILTANRDILFNPRYGTMGMVAYPFFFFGEMLAPVVELCGYIALVLGFLVGGIDWEYARLFLIVAIGYGILLSFWAIVLEELSFRRYPRYRDLLWMFAFAVLENLGYRQMTVWFRLKAFWMFFRREHGWGKMEREGFAGRPDSLDSGAGPRPGARGPELTAGTDR
ncbi:MAG TPA: glycosyltransferase [Gemmatimonadaceae bacterium]|nr:glycosyltransferase [Gemmatimonadaceae bacterium]